MDSEKKIFELLETKTPMTKYWLPLTWATNIINRARKEMRITNDHMVQTIMLEMSDIRARLGSLIGYDNVNIPIVYTQVINSFAQIRAPILGKKKKKNTHTACDQSKTSHLIVNKIHYSV